MILILMELDGCLITLYLFQEKYGIHLYVGIHLRVEEERKS